MIQNYKVVSKLRVERKMCISIDMTLYDSNRLKILALLKNTFLRFKNYSMNMLDIARYIKESLDHSVFFRDFEFIYEDGTYKIYICEIVKDFELQLEEK
jgi:hypothetical protein